MAKTSSTACVWDIAGMDCAGCAAKVRRAVEGLTGVSEVEVSLNTQRLSLYHDPELIAHQQIEETVSKLGYGIKGNKLSCRTETPVSACGCCAPKAESHEHAHGHSHDHGFDENLRWWQRAQNRLIMLTGGLLLIAWSISLFVSHDSAYWAFAVASVIGLIPVVKAAFGALRAGVPFTIEMLMTISAIGALLIGAAEEASIIVFLFAVGEALEGLAANRARVGIKALNALMPKSAQLEEGDSVREVAAETLEVGQIVRVRPGDRVPTDGKIIEGISGIDESPVTGESVPVTKSSGDDVFAGTINAESVLRVRVTKAFADNTLSRIIEMIEAAESNRAPTERFIDRFSRYYMPAICLVALMVAVVPPLAFAGDWATWIYRALALMLVGCPCALVISVPASIASALYTGTRQGLLMKGGAVIEAAAHVDIVAFDKTGTLTFGQPQVTDIETLTGDENHLLQLAAAIEQDSSHPLAQAIVARAREAQLSLPLAQQVKAHPGLGVSGVIDQQNVELSSAHALEAQGALSAETVSRVEALEHAGKTVVVIRVEDKVLGIIALRDEPRPDAAEAIENLKRMGVRPVMLTGDNPRTAAAIAATLGLEYKAGLMPADKVAEIQQLVKNHQVMMVGDGINDAPALASAHVGVAMGSASDVALETADGVLLGNGVNDVAEKIRLSRAALHNIHQNVALALGLKALVLVTSLLGVTGLWVAVLADTGTTVLVTANALRLLRFKMQKR